MHTRIVLCMWCAQCVWVQGCSSTPLHMYRPEVHIKYLPLPLCTLISVSQWALTSPTDLASLSPCLRHWACTCALPCPAFMQILGVQPPQVLILVYRASWLQAPVCRPPFPLSPGWPLSKFSHYIFLLPECLFSSLRASKQQQLFSLANSDFFRSS